MSAFEDFIQTELPKRPYTGSDTAQESVLVRRGLGPRQHVGVALSEGQVLAMVGGVIVGVAPASLGLGIRTAVLPVPVAGTLWTINHGYNSQNAIIQITDENGVVVLADEMRFVDNDTITISFNSPQAGTAKVIWLD